MQGYPRLHPQYACKMHKHICPKNLTHQGVKSHPSMVKALLINPQAFNYDFITSSNPSYWDFKTRENFKNPPKFTCIINGRISMVYRKNGRRFYQ